PWLHLIRATLVRGALVLKHRCVPLLLTVRVNRRTRYIVPLLLLAELLRTLLLGLLVSRLSAVRYLRQNLAHSPNFLFTPGMHAHPSNLNSFRAGDLPGCDVSAQCRGVNSQLLCCLARRYHSSSCVADSFRSVKKKARVGRPATTGADEKEFLI